MTDTKAMEKIRTSVNDPVRELAYLPDMEAPPHYLREWRKFRRMTQDELAAAVGTSKSVISDLERVQLQLSPKWLHRLAPVLRTQPGYILDRDPESLDTDIIDIWAHIPDDDKATARRVLESFRRTGTGE
jgi:transcriptional regulator with XRE-family HTH domain